MHMNGFYLSPDPQALPHAAFLSPEPHALPQAAFLSEEPQALPQGAPACALFVFHPAKFFSAICMTSFIFDTGFPPPLCDHYAPSHIYLQVRTFFCGYAPKSNYCIFSHVTL
jgi:hypothetical protein